MRIRRRHRALYRRSFAVGLAAVLGTAMLVTVSTASQPRTESPPAPTPGDQHALRWGVKESLRTHISRTAHGDITVDASATRDDDGLVGFGDATGVADGQSVELSFAGSVHFTAHDGLLDISIAAPTVVVDGNSGLLIADVTSKSTDSGEIVEYPDVELAELDLVDAPLTVDDGVASASDVLVTLAKAGVPALAGFYPAGTTLDPVSFTAPVQGDAATTPAPVPDTIASTAEHGTPRLAVEPSEDLEVGQQVEVTGSGFAPHRKISIAITAGASTHEEYGWPSGWLGHDVVETDADGNLSRTLTIAGTVTGTDDDCRDVQCYVAGFNSAQADDADPVDRRGDRSQDVFVPVDIRTG